MPTYCYKCEECSNTSLFKMSYSELDSFSPECECGETMNRYYSGEGIGKPRFSGSGFHATDYDTTEGNGRYER